MRDSAKLHEAKRPKGGEGGTEPGHTFAQAPGLVFHRWAAASLVAVVMNRDPCFASSLYPLSQHQGIRVFRPLDGVRMPPSV